MRQSIPNTLSLHLLSERVVQTIPWRKHDDVPLALTTPADHDDYLTSGIDTHGTDFLPTMGIANGRPVITSRKKKVN